MQLADAAVAFYQARQTLFQHRIGRVFVKLLHHHRFWKRKSGSSIRFADDPCRVPLPDTRSRKYAVESNTSPRPVFTEQLRLGFASGREFIVVLLKEGSLPVTNQQKTAHSLPHDSVNSGVRRVDQLNDWHRAGVPCRGRVVRISRKYRRETQLARSNRPAAPWPPPTHIVTTP